MTNQPVLPDTRKGLSQADLFWLFTKMSLLGFGGVLPWAYRVLVDRERVLSNSEFAELLGFAQLLPGPTICNLAVVVGYRNAGIRGGMAALAGMLVAPLIIVIALGTAYQHARDFALVRHALAGMSAVAAGLVLGMGCKLATELPRNWRNFIFAVSAFLSIGVMRWPLLAVIAVILPLALAVKNKS